MIGLEKHLHTRAPFQRAGSVRTEPEFKKRNLRLKVIN